MENLIAHDAVGLIIQAISAIVIATITYVLGPVVVGKIAKPSEPSIPHQASKFKYAIAAGITAAITFAVMGLLFGNSSCPIFAPTRVAINSPTPVAGVSRLAIVQGTACHIPNGSEVWLFVVPEGVAGYYPQTGPIVISNDGSWSGSAYIGTDNPADVGKGFMLIAALADQQGSAAIREYFAQSGPEFRGLEPLPLGVQLMGQVSVVRK